MPSDGLASVRDAEVALGRTMELPLRTLSDDQTVDRMLNSFFLNTSSEDLQGVPPAWSTQSGFSIFDEDEVLASTLPKSDKLESQEPLQKVSHDTSENFWTPQDSEMFPRGPACSSARSKLKLLKRSSLLHRLEAESGSQCSICLDKIMHGQMAWTLPCFHGFHLSCAERFFGTRGVQPRCPMCRFDIRQGVLQQRALLEENA
mmetsp:Transcript_3169/g.7587  ORF Transcript_3169/g.7587 Transcript_3169/m.7587 type:complete len:203 (-) Transcript_3169:130-738(-)